MTGYFIFARKEYHQPLEYIGALQVQAGAPPTELDRRARAQFGSEGWVEMVAVPETSVVRVIPVE